MQFQFDHIISIMIAGVVLMIFAYIQIRGTAAATEATLNHLVYTEAMNIDDLLERDLENLLTDAQTQTAINAGVYTGPSSFNCNLVTDGSNTLSLTFPTLIDPDSALVYTGDPNESGAMEVTYNLVTTGDSTVIPVNSVNQIVPLYELQRTINGNVVGNSLPYVTHFTVQFGILGSNDFVPLDGAAAGLTSCGDLRKVRYEFKLAGQNLEFITQDQRSTSLHNITRFGSTVSLPNWE